MATGNFSFRMSHSSSNSSSMISYEVYKALITDVADALMEEDVEKIIWLYDLQRKATKRDSPLDVLTILHKNGKLSAENLDGLKSLLEKIRRKDLIEKHLNPFYQLSETSSRTPSSSPAEQGAFSKPNMEESLTNESYPPLVSPSRPNHGQEKNNAPITMESVTPYAIPHTTEGYSESPASMRSIPSDASSLDFQEYSRYSVAAGHNTKRSPLLRNLSHEPRNISLNGRRRLKETRSMDDIMELASEGLDRSLRTEMSCSVSLQELKSERGTPTGSSRAEHRVRRPRMFRWMKKPFGSSTKAAARPEGTLQWHVKIEQIQKYIYSRKSQDKMITCSKKLEVTAPGCPPLKLGFQIHPYGSLSDANRYVTFFVRIEHHKKAKQSQVSKGTKVVFQLTVSSNEQEFHQHNCVEDFRMSSFYIEQMISHDTLKSLDRTHTHLVLAVQAYIQLPFHY